MAAVPQGAPIDKRWTTDEVAAFARQHGVDPDRARRWARRHGGQAAAERVLDAALSREDEERDARESRKARVRHARHQVRALLQAHEDRAAMSLGRRLDAALSRASLLSEATAVQPRQPGTTSRPAAPGKTAPTGGGGSLDGTAHSTRDAWASAIERLVVLLERETRAIDGTYPRLAQLPTDDRDALIAECLAGLTAHEVAQLVPGLSIAVIHAARERHDQDPTTGH